MYKIFRKKYSLLQSLNKYTQIKTIEINDDIIINKQELQNEMNGGNPDAI